jgi:FkbM family methyltransferase
MAKHAGGWGGQSAPGAEPRVVAALERGVHMVVGAVLNPKRRVIRGEVERALASAGRPERMPVEFRAQFGEDMWLWDLFEGKLDGRFIEVGAFDGHHLSVSYVFEAVGWTGVLIEPIPEAYEACRARRTASRVVHAALSKRGSTGIATLTHAPRDGTLSYLKTNPEHEADVQRREGGGQRRIQVPLRTMDEVLGDNPGQIDFVVIDVEGGEHDLLDGFSLDRYRPRVVMIEEGVERPVSPFEGVMKKAGYRVAATVAINRVFIREDETALLARAGTLGQL